MASKKPTAASITNSDWDNVPTFISCHFPVGRFPQLYQNDVEISPEEAYGRFQLEQNAERARKRYQKRKQDDLDRHVRLFAPKILWNVSPDYQIGIVSVWFYNQSSGRLRGAGKIMIDLWHLPVKEETLGFINEQKEMIVNFFPK